MSTTAPGTGELTGSALDPRVTLRCVTVATAATAATWHAVSAASLPAEATGTIAGGLALSVLQLAWTVWLVRRPSRRCLLAGATATAAMLVASALVLWAGTGQPSGVALVTGAVLQLTLLMLTLLGAARAPSPRVLKGATLAGLICVAVTMSVVVAGGSHLHARALGPAEPARGTTALLCHLI
ncbi:MAG: hypothetical protein JWO02_2728 [Solirubrobacterales bacterium]|nr:hypothetical protein [Solirubrobacterales bacterium]